MLLRGLASSVGVLTMIGCSCATEGRVLPDGSVPTDATPRPDVSLIDVSLADATIIDPFDPRNQCAASTIPTNSVPGTVLIVFDNSGSMVAPISGNSGPTRWQLATAAVRNTVDELPDEVNVGLLIFPSTSCDVEGFLDVPIAPLTTSRAAIYAALNPNDPPPNSNLTPLTQGIQQAYDLIRDVDDMGGRGVLVVTDGTQTCGFDRESSGRTGLVTLLSSTTNEAAAMLSEGVRTYVVGLQIQNGFMSQLAQAGGTALPGCNPACGEYAPMECLPPFGDCADSSRDCDFSTGFCGCVRNTDCGSGRSCRGGECVPDDGNELCCSYSVGSANFQTEFQTALAEITAGFRGDCIFEVPRGTGDFDPELVNVGITFPGEERQLVPRSADPAMSGWRYADDTQTTLEIGGALCERLRTSAGTVQIVLGCPTIIG